ncbi:MAG: LamG-like jellyroll fold domain-containing protein [Planctomycetota bacterium]
MRFSILRPGAALVLVVTLATAARAQTAEPVRTDRTDARPLTAPAAEPVWHFAIFGDRTGGPESGLAILREAVGDTNLLSPDLVLTVGDLVQGYNASDLWLRQMRDYREIMDGLDAPWYPVAGNHDVYYRGEDRPKGGHEGNYEKHFGPLWYWFRHKDAAFIVLYSDEGDPKDDSKGFKKERHVQFSDRQLAWLKETLAETRKLRHGFVFLHHPRWRSDYYENSNWDTVERMLVESGNIRGVFAGHMHEMRYDRGERGLELFTLGATGSSLSRDFPAGGFMHHYDLVTVRPEGVSVAAFPVGAALDHRRLDPAYLRDLRVLLDRRRPEAERELDLSRVADPGDGVTLVLHNPAARPIRVEFELAPESGAWSLSPARPSLTLAPGASERLELSLALDPRLARGGFGAARLVERVTLLRDDGEIALPLRDWDVPAFFPAGRHPETDGRDRALALDGRSCARIGDPEVPLPDGPFTLEGRFLAKRYRDRQPFLAKTQNSEYSLFLDRGVPSFSVHLDGAYVHVRAENLRLETDRWYHLAGVFDGGELRLYLDGALIGRTPAKGTRTRNVLPLLVGADPDGSGVPTDQFEGLIDEVRLSRKARYAGERVRVPARHEPDAETLLLLDFDLQVGGLFFDRSGADRKVESRGRAAARPVGAR